MKLVKFGQYLHYLQDMEPHDTYGSLWGHAVPGHAPDSPGNDKSKFEITTSETLLSLNELLVNLDRSPKTIDMDNIIQPIIDEIVSQSSSGTLYPHTNKGHADNRVTIETAMENLLKPENLDVPFGIQWVGSRPLIPNVLEGEFNESNDSDRGEPIEKTWPANQHHSRMFSVSVVDKGNGINVALDIEEENQASIHMLTNDDEPIGEFDLDDKGWSITVIGDDFEGDEHNDFILMKYDIDTWTDVMRADFDTGNVGFGNALQVADIIESTFGGFKFPDGSIQTTASTAEGVSYWTQIGDDIYYDTGNVGIGISNPTVPLEVAGSVEFGDSTTASGSYSAAFGYGTTASGIGSVAFGDSTTASGNRSVAFGDSTTASSTTSAAFGLGTTASDIGSTAFGGDTTASSLYSTAFGYGTTASGGLSTAFGSSTTASGDGSTAFGYYTTAQPYASFVIGQYNEISGDTDNWIDTDPLFVIGNGVDASNPHNIMTVLKNGNVGIGTSDPPITFHVKGDAGGSGAWNAASSQKWKTDITPLNSTLDKITQIQGVTYKWKVDEFPEMSFENSTQIGIIAEELEKVFPELVNTDQNGDKSIQYGKLTPILIEAIKEQQKEMDEQQKVNESQQLVLEELKTVICPNYPELNACQ